MIPLEIYGPLKQARTAYDVLEILSDPKKLKEVKEVLKGIEDERNKVNAAIATFGKAKSIGRLHNNAANKEAEAHRVLQAGEADAKEMRARAKFGINAALEKVRLREVAVDAEEKALDKRAIDETMTLNEREVALVKREEMVAAREKSLSNRSDDMQKRETAYLDRKKALVDLGAQAKAIPAL